LNQADLKDFLEVKYRQFNDLSFIENDPISIPHRFSHRDDIEISGFLASTLAWGQRPVIIKNMNRLMELMENAPADFIRNFKNRDIKRFNGFCHRTFNAEDCKTYLRALQRIYRRYSNLEAAFHLQSSDENFNLNVLISMFRAEFLSIPHQHRVGKHLPDPLSGSAAKRINMFLRWMVRKDNSGVDFGIWNSIKPSELMLPLDVHSGRIARSLGLLKRNQNDWKAVEEVTAVLRKLEPEDPVKYDFALFGMGVSEKF
jgi:uncharacterized protein (TIGR02757 family)